MYLILIKDVNILKLTSVNLEIYADTNMFDFKIKNIMTKKYKIPHQFH